MRAFLADKGAARRYWPERLELLPELPRTASGKIRKVELREMMGGGA
jgi:acyl-coenzyme A synthetase/AMP-(fatty) acid ligase